MRREIAVIGEGERRMKALVLDHIEALREHPVAAALSFLVTTGGLSGLSVHVHGIWRVLAISLGGLLGLELLVAHHFWTTLRDFRLDSARELERVSKERDDANVAALAKVPQQRVENVRVTRSSGAIA